MKNQFNISMKSLAILVAMLLVLPFAGNTQGTSCANAITIPLDGMLNTYPASSATGANVLCTNNGTTPVTWFKFTTNAQAECPLLNITASDSMAVEVAFYTSCSSMLTSSGMCFYTGYGLWAPNENFLISGSTTYYLRVKTSTLCNLKIAGQHFSPPNDNCLGAVSIDAASLLPDNNSCNHAAVGITASQLCGLILENTAWYQFYVATTGYSIITISNIHCDNGAANNNNGFQIGFFTGTCSALQWQNCENGSGTTVQATTTSLPAGTKVFVAIDGVSGANCSYTINGFNITSVLSGSLTRFSGWKSTKSNILQWNVSHEKGGHYIVERSGNGVDFQPIGKVKSKSTADENASYIFEDTYPLVKAFYRLRQIDLNEKVSLTNTISINRAGVTGLQVSIANPVGSFMQLDVGTDFAGQYQSRILNMEGQTLLNSTMHCDKGMNHFSEDVSKLPPGQYCLAITSSRERVNKLFIKN